MTWYAFCQHLVPLCLALTCPFHKEKEPSFIVFPDTQTWRCFGACNAGGDLFDFVQKKEGWDLQETIRFLAGKAGVSLQPLSAREQKAVLAVLIRRK